MFNATCKTRACPSRRRQRVHLVQSRTFFMIPALRFEKVMWRRDLSWMNLISIFLRSRPGLSSSSSSSSAAGRGRLVPRLASAFSWPLPSSCSDGDAFWSCSVISLAIAVVCRARSLVAVFGGGRPNCLGWLFVWGDPRYARRLFGGQRCA
jgi:hypothetical protein